MTHEAAATQTAVALFKGYTDVVEPMKFFLPIFEFNNGATVAGCVALTLSSELTRNAWLGTDKDECRYHIGRAYQIEYTRHNREVVRVVGEVAPDGTLLQ